MNAVTAMKATVPAIPAGTPHAESSSPSGPESVDPPYAEAKKPASVTPTCTDARNRFESERSFRTRSPRLPASRSTWLSRSETSASSDAEK